MILLRVLSYNGAPADGPQAQFDEIGGTIGRSDNNQLVLPDPERTISRVHARVVFRSGGYAVVDNGSNPISVNGQTVGAGRAQPLRPGDQLQIGGYVLAASEAAAALSTDPFADLFGDAAGLAVPPPTPPAAARAKPAMRSPARAAMPASASWPPPAPQGANSFGAPPPPAWPARAAPAARLGAGQIPEDWDPFGPDPADGAPQGPAVGQGGAHDPFSDMAGGATASLDDLFGLADTPLQADPLAPAPRTARVRPATDSDHASDLHTPMPRPMQVKSSASAAQAAPSPLTAGAVFSWNDPPTDGRVVTLPGVQRATGAEAFDADSSAGRLAHAFGSELPLASAAASSATPVAPSVAPSVVPSVEPPGALPPPTPRPTASASDNALLNALLQGLDSPSLRLDALTPDTMLLLGQLLRESMRGSVELLLARAALKREMRAEMTMIVARENNPLKFSPTVEVALQHLLGPPVPGFMPPAAAVRDAFDDLRAHQLGVMAGMRAALDGVLQRFDPQQLEGKLTRKSAIASLIPATRKARLWELFQELFAQLQGEAQDDFDELFGRAFLKAYEDQLDRLRAEPGPR